MDDNVDVTTPNERDTVVDIDTAYDNYTDDENEDYNETMENDWQGPVVQECEGVQHDVVPDDQEDPIRLAREEVQASRRNSYSTREK
ncbi:hypothetical protein AMTR_s00018p00110560 [Amborella trichopoda]|uniref:Uncharacterized protein n=1 Tax=Amborella trichopoda TaxID=13333 RepID=W1PJH0_AMBTC|nr:hypothetical protein AMTR_s00018p00110560 [Amborella trichopoda]